nr:hypothetical protein CFP56_47692 [Quercus suber]
MPPKATLPTRTESQWKAHIILNISIKFLQELTTISSISKIFICYDVKIHSGLPQPEDSWNITDDVLGELPTIALIETAGATWTLHFDGSSTTSEGGARIVLSKVLEKQWVGGLFEEFNSEHSLRSDNHFTDASATLGSKIRFEGVIADVTIVKRTIPVVRMQKEEFSDQPLGQTDWQSFIKRSTIITGNTISSCNPDRLQHYLAAFNPAAPLPVAILTNCNIALLPSV